jgi:hypothetical protein
MGYLADDREEALLRKKAPKLDTKTASAFVKLANAVRKAADQEQVFCTFSTRRLLALARKTAEVIPAPPNRKLKSGKMIRITSGPAEGSEHISMSGATEAATENQRKEQSLGRKGCLSGWDFWRPEG